MSPIRLYSKNKSRIMKIFLILISIFYTYSEILIAQSTMKIRKIDGTLSAYNLSRIDSIYFSTEIPSVTVKDIDGNAYKLVTIGTQVWFSENLKTTRYRNGDSIGTTIPAEKDILSEIAPKYQWAYNGDNSIVGVFGRLYTGNVVIDSRGVCPVGYHVPSDAEWTTLTDLLGGLS
jgi:hypothetical protein